MKLTMHQPPPAVVQIETSDVEINFHVLDVIPKVGPPSTRHSLSKNEVNEFLASIQFGDDLDAMEKEDFLCMLHCYAHLFVIYYKHLWQVDMVDTKLS